MIYEPPKTNSCWNFTLRYLMPLFRYSVIFSYLRIDPPWANWTTETSPLSTSVSVYITCIRSFDPHHAYITILPFGQLSLNKQFFQMWWCGTESEPPLTLSYLKQLIVVVQSDSPGSCYKGVRVSVWIHFIKDCSPFPARPFDNLYRDSCWGKGSLRETHAGTFSHA